jgi:hypoxanthine phosphoribosyltransferase
MSPPAKDSLQPGRILITEEELRARVTELGRAIGRDYAGGQPPIIVGVLQGAFLFMADLVRAIPIPVTTDFIGLASYGAGTSSTGVVRLQFDLSMSIERRPVVIVEDIADTGLTLSYLKRALEARHPESVRVCVLVDKIERRRAEIDIDYIGFTIPDVFVVGYGMDWSGLYRNLPHVAVLEDASVTR